MDFRKATDALTTCPTMAQLADAMGVAENTIARARMDPASRNARTAPPGWQKAVAKLARKRARDLEKLAEDLER